MIVVCSGTRPEFIKMAPILLELKRRNIEHVFVDTGQHYDWNMNGRFIKELGLRQPDMTLRQTDEKETECEFLVLTMAMLDLLFQEEGIKPTKNDVILVQGDTTSSLACALYGNKNKIPVGHVEAGLRSNDNRMPEEYNRRIIDHVSSFCFAPTGENVRNLARERVLGMVELTGNTIIDALDLFLNKATTITISSTDGKLQEFILATFHRQENVDNPKVLKTFLDVCRDVPLPVIYPIHHRTRMRIEENNFEIPSNLHVIEPLGYFKFLGYLKSCSLVLTDSGGIQEEVTHPKIRKHCVVMRESTERYEAEERGFTTVVRTMNRDRILDEIKTRLRSLVTLPSESPYGDGNASKRIVDVLR